jgi:hypothetical protein
MGPSKEARFADTLRPARHIRGHTFTAHSLACTHPCQSFAGNLAAPTHDSGPARDATPFTVMDFHLQLLPVFRRTAAQYPIPPNCCERFVAAVAGEPRNTRYRAGAAPYPDRTRSGWIRSAYPDAPPDSGRSLWRVPRVSGRLPPGLCRIADHGTIAVP